MPFASHDPRSRSVPRFIRRWLTGNRSIRAWVGGVATVAALGLVLGAAVPAALASEGPASLWTRVRHLAGWKGSDAPLAPGDTVVVWGPQRFSTPTGKSTMGVERFTLGSDPMRHYVLRVENGAPNGDLAVGTLSVVLNGSTVLTAQDFAGKRIVDRPVQLTVEDTVTVQIDGVPNAYVTVSLLQAPDPTFAVFPATTFVRNSGTPLTDTRHFSVGATAGAPYYMCILNGQADGSLRASSATVRINGQEVLEQFELNRQVASLLKPVPLIPGADNLLEVDMTSTPSSRLTLCLRATDITPPELTIVTPAAGRSVTRAATVDVTGTVRDETATTVTVNGAATTRSGEQGTGYSATIPLAAEGDNRILVRAIDAAGHVVDSTRTVIRDTQAPQLALDAPADGLITNQATQAVRGTAQDRTNVTVNVNGAPYPVGADGSFAGSVTLVEGSNFVTATATDEAGNASSIAHAVILDTRPPTIIVDAPAAGLLTNRRDVTVSGRVSDATPVSFRINGAAVTVASGGAWQAVVSLGMEGENEIVFDATDAAGNTARAARVVNRDTEAPVIALAAPTDGQITNKMQQTASGTVSDRSAVTLTVNGAATTVASGGAFTAPVTLAEGTNTVTVVARDAAGNESTAARQLTLDTQPPVVTLATPAEGLITNASTVTVTGTATDPALAEVMVNGAAVTVDASGGFSTTVPLATDGAATITVVATDRAGNQGSAARSMTRDTQPPVVTIATPTDGLLTKGGTVVVTGTVLDATAVVVDVNGVPAVLGVGGSFSVETTLGVEGTNPIVVHAVDAAGNVSAPMRGVTRDTQAPVIVVNAPVEGSTTPSGSVTVTGTVTDASPVTLTVRGSAAVVATGGGFSADVQLARGANAIALVATDAAGNVGTASVGITRRTLEPGVPPDPSTVAPRLDMSVATTQREATTFLYTGSNPIQTGVAAGAIDPVIQGTVRGRVLTKSGDPLQGVTVSVRGKSQFGQTKSREDGWYDLVVNGGGDLTLDFTKTGYLPAQRSVAVPWNAFAKVDDVVLIQPDGVVTTVDLGSPDVQVARSSVQQDADGPRQLTVLVEPGTQATMTLADGTTRPLTTLNLRATEFTVGANGPQAMPGALPAQSMYTYAMQLTADEVPAGATLTFSKPVPIYLDNFLQLPAGTTVPVGGYDAAKGAWVAEPNGVVITVLAIENGVAQIDVNGDGQPESEATLAAMGLDPAERATLAKTYQPGKSLWRTTTIVGWPHDYNFPGSPTGRPPQMWVAPGCAGRNADPIRCQIQKSRQKVGLAGTPYSLAYNSGRTVGGGDHSIAVNLTEATLPPNLFGVELQITVGGQYFHQAWKAEPNMTYTYEWDGKDAYGRTVQGTQPVTVRIGYQFPTTYSLPNSLVDKSFAETCSGTVGGGPGTCTLPAVVAPTSPRYVWPQWQTIETTVGGWNAQSEGMGGFTLSEHHVYDPAARTVYLGDGTERPAARLPDVVTTIAGIGGGWYNGDGLQGMKTAFRVPNAVAAVRDGSLIISDQWNCRIRKMAPDGIVSTVSGNGDCNHSGNNLVGVPATTQQHYLPLLVVKARDGGFYTLDYGESRVRYVSPQGLMRTVAGAGVMFTQTSSGDGGLATDAFFTDISGMAEGPDGSLYISDRSANRVRRVSPAGIITTFAGNGGSGMTGDGGPATRAEIFWPGSLGVGLDGTVYVGCGGWGDQMRKIAPDGTITTLIGKGPYGYSDGVKATQSYMGGIGAIRVRQDGTVFFQASDRIFFLTPDERIYAITGAPGGPTLDQGTPALGSFLQYQGAFDIAPDGAIYTTNGLGFIRKIAPSMPGVQLGEITLASPDGTEVYVFDAAGRHLRTLDALGGGVRLAFTYDARGGLLSLTDRYGQTTTIERDASGVATAVVAPDGRRTTLAMDGSGNIATITDPAGHDVTFAFGPGGLLTGTSRADGSATSYAYDSDGRLLSRTRDGATTTFAAATSAAGTDLTISTPGAHTTTLGVTTLASGAQQQTLSLAGAGATQETINLDGSRTTRTADGTTTTVVERADPRFAMQSPLTEETVVTPRGLRRVRRLGRAVVLAAGSDPSALVTQADSTILNGKASVTLLDKPARRVTTRSAEGRESYTVEDTLGRVVEEAAAGALPVQRSYDDQRHTLAITQGDRVVRITHDSLGRQSSVTDPLGGTIHFGYGADGTLVERRFPDGSAIEYAYDSAGRRTLLTSAGHTEHRFGYNGFGLNDRYVAPTVDGQPSTTWLDYNADRQLTRVLRPDSSTIEYTYDAAGRQATVVTARGTTRYAYSTTTGQLFRVTAPDGGVMTLDHDGALLTGTTWAGDVTGSVSMAYNNDFNVATQLVNGASPVGVQYDADGLATTVGALTITRNPGSGRVAATSLGTVATAQAFTAHGQMESLTATAGTAMLYTSHYTHDQAGHVITATETIGGTTTAYGYAYDVLGRLREVTRDGAVAASYEYDANGNRTRASEPSGSAAAAYDAQDRLISAGDATYGYGLAGELQERRVGSAVTRYRYDALGNLLGVVLPDSTRIDYLVDGSNRRIGRKVNGVLTRGYLYAGQQIVAELNGANQVVSRFVYGTRGNVPDYMVKGGQTYRIIADRLGNVRLVVDAASGAVAQRLEYDAWGRVTANSSPGFQPFGFAGGLYDDSTQLVRFGARDYDGSVGRWTTKDPTLFSGDDANLYRYALGDPVNVVDPAGSFGLLTEQMVAMEVNVTLEYIKGNARAIAAPLEKFNKSNIVKRTKQMSCVISDALAEWAEAPESTDEDYIADLMQLHQLSVGQAAIEGAKAAMGAMYEAGKRVPQLIEFRDKCYGGWFYNAGAWNQEADGPDTGMRGRKLSPLSSYNTMGRLCRDQAWDYHNKQEEEQKKKDEGSGIPMPSWPGKEEEAAPDPKCLY